MVLTEVSLENTLREFRGGLLEGKLPTNFWENLVSAPYDPSIAQDKEGDIINYDSHLKHMNVALKRTDIHGATRYHLTIKDNASEVEAILEGAAPLESRKLLISSRSFEDFDIAMGRFFAAHQKVNELGY